MRFSERNRYTPIRQVVQRENMDTDLQVGLWNVMLRLIFWEWNKPTWSTQSSQLARRIWEDFYKQNIRAISVNPRAELLDVERQFLSYEWFKVYDFVEFIAENAHIIGSHTTIAFPREINEMLSREMAAYRLMGNNIVEVTSECEIAAIETAENFVDRLSPVSQHIQAAGRLLSDRTKPDYRNSIKESISAVESMCRLATGRGTLAGALAVLPKKGITVHPAILDAFKKLYGYTSDADGIRHALLDQDSLDQEDAKFMLVTCSAFVNLVRAREAEISKAAS